MDNHTKEPWAAPSAGIYAGGAIIATTGTVEITKARRKAGHHPAQCIYDACRIVACVNALAGIPQSELDLLVGLSPTTRLMALSGAIDRTLRGILP